MCFFCHFRIFITLHGEEGTGFFAYRAFVFVSYEHVNLCHFFSSSWCQGMAAASACGSSWTFLFTLFSKRMLQKGMICLIATNVALGYLLYSNKWIIATMLFASSIIVVYG